MLSIDKTVEVLDALRYCNKHIIGIANDRVKHFYKIKHGMLAHMYRKPKSISGYRVKLNSIEIQLFGQHETKLFSISVTNDTCSTYTFHVPMSNKNIRAFDPDYFFRWNATSVIDELPKFPYESDGKELGDEETWMKYYSMLKVIAYSWDVINASEEKLTKLTKHPEKWKENWPSFVREFNKRFRDKYTLENDPDNPRKCKIIHCETGRCILHMWKFRAMKTNGYREYMTNLDRSIKWH